MGLYNLLPILLNESITIPVFFMLIFRLGTIFAAIGLVLIRGWGRNSAIFFNGISAIYSMLEFLQNYLASSMDVPFVIYAIFSFISIGAIFYYLFRTTVKEMFPEHFLSWCVLGLLLAAFGMWGNDSQNIIISTFWYVLMIVGLAIGGYGVKGLRKNYPQDPVYFCNNK